MPSRDSILWWLILAGAVLAYLSNSTPPDTWTWNQWMQALSALVGIVATWLRSSPLRGSVAKDAVDPSRFTGLLLVAVLLLPAVACGPKSASTNPRHPAVVASVGLGQALFALDDGERSLYAAGKVTPSQHKAISGPLADVLQVGRDANAAILAWRPGQSAPQALRSMLPKLEVLTKDAIDALPGEPRASLMAYVSQVYAAVALVLTFMVGGA
jgi:hypothetical protein